MLHSEWLPKEFSDQMEEWWYDFVWNNFLSHQCSQFGKYSHVFYTTLTRRLVQHPWFAFGAVLVMVVMAPFSCLWCLLIYLGHLYWYGLFLGSWCRCWSDRVLSLVLLLVLALNFLILQGWLNPQWLIHRDVVALVIYDQYFIFQCFPYYYLTYFFLIYN